MNLYHAKTHEAVGLPTMLAAPTLPSTADVIGCLEEAQKELAHGDARHNWWADVHLKDAASELAKLRRLVAKLPKEC